MAKTDNKIFAVSFFADDIRNEIGDKITVVGVYGGDVVLPEIPAVIARIGILTVVLVPISVKQVTELKFKLVQTNDEVIEHSVPENILSKMPREENGRMRYEIAAVFSPLNIEKAGSMVASVQVNGKEVFSGSINVVQDSQMKGEFLQDSQMKEEVILPEV